MWVQLYSSGDMHSCRELGLYIFIVIGAWGGVVVKVLRY